MKFKIWKHKLRWYLIKLEYKFGNLAQKLF